jgi:hypothetical protein
VDDSLNVVSLHNGPIPTLNGKPDESCICMLKQLLADAESGRLSAFAFAALTPDGLYKSNWNGAAEESATMIAGILARLSFEFNKRLYDHTFGESA